MPDQTTNLQLPFLKAGQAQKHVTVNESLLRLDALVQLSVVSATVTAQPGSPSDGQVYILPAGKTGAAWGAMTDLALAYYRDGAWEQITPREGWLAYVRDTDVFLFHDSVQWTQNAAGLASNAEARGQTNTKKALTPSNLNARSGFRATMSADQTGIADATWTKITMPTETFDRAGDYDGANSRHTPQSATAHEWHAQLQFTTGAVAGQTYGVSIGKNGAQTFKNVAAVPLSGNATIAITAADLPNGSSDYYEVFGYLDTISGTGTAIAAGTRFHGKAI
jgi:hypothetical protein